MWKIIKINSSNLAKMLMQRNLHVLTRNKLLSIYYFIFFKPGSNNLRFNTIDIAFSVLFTDRAYI